jgi:hypothetical protein
MPRLLRTAIVALIAAWAVFTMRSPASAGCMTLIGVGNANCGAGGGVTAQSIVTASGAQQYLTTTWSHAPTNPKKATIAYWQKFTNLGALTSDNYAFTTASTGGVLFDHKWNNSIQHYFVVDDIGSVYNVNGGSGAAADANWHHICIQIDTTAGTPVVIWVDGVNPGSTGTQPAANSDMGVTANTLASYIGTVSYNLIHVTDAKFAYFYLIDGQALPASSFTTGTGAGSIHPITYTGTYGNNGFFLNGSGSTLNDQSGNANNWTAPNGITFSADLPT